ncbi:imelysin family protein [Ahrensia sp. 13_GOM-1096m]|uniref:imelysin family protein n=1 Tax=Ahrensia sp. 13_GOM-1096m TaxID=1380380 RepID=UPI00047D50AF|nr:imelysin family protein [Ahrensia sp. 13_GOM-1096m]
MRVAFTGLIVAVALLTGTVQGAFARDANDIVRDVIADYIRPATTALKARANTMHAAANVLCEKPNAVALSTARDEFSALVKDWGQVELLRLGPLAQDNRLERMLFWPDRRGRGLKQVRDIVRSGDETALDAASLSDKSVAVQGLLALEYTLFGDDSAALATSDGAVRCQYMQAITENIANVTGEIEAAWYDDGPQAISTLWQNPSDTNPLFRDGREQLSALFKIVGGGLEIVSVQRIQPFLDDGFESVKPKSALFWRSDNAVNIIASNFAGLNAIMRAADLTGALEGDVTRTANSVFFEFDNAARTLNAINKPTADIAVNADDYDKFSYVNIVGRSIETILREQLSPAFNLSSGFSSLDGD